MPHIIILFLAAVLLAAPAEASTVNKFFRTKGPDGSSALMPPITTYVNTYSLAAATAESITWPAGYNRMNISCAQDFWVRNGGTAVVGASDVTDGTGSARSIGARVKGSESSISIISTNAQVCSVEFWSDIPPAE